MRPMAYLVSARPFGRGFSHPSCHRLSCLDPSQDLYPWPGLFLCPWPQRLYLHHLPLRPHLVVPDAFQRVYAFHPWSSPTTPEPGLHLPPGSLGPAHRSVWHCRCGSNRSATAPKRNTRVKHFGFLTSQFSPPISASTFVRLPSRISSWKAKKAPSIDAHLHGCMLMQPLHGGP